MNGELNGVPPEGIEVPVVDDFKWNGWEGFLVWSMYKINGRTKLLMFGERNENVELIIEISVNIVELQPMKCCFFVKDWSENEGVFDALVEQGVVEDTGRRLSMETKDVFGASVVVKEARIIPFQSYT